MAQIFAAEWAANRDCVTGPVLREGPEAASQRKAAHDLVTNAGALGFAELSSAARRLEQAVVKGDAVEHAKAACDVATFGRDALAELKRRYLLD
jgi:HPt (histidine-containing phosphotransfer) domain-containing protein